MYSYIWQPIEDLPDHWSDLSAPGLSIMIEAWKQRVKQLQGSDILEDFKYNLRREWLGEVDVLEYLYSTDRGTTRILIEQGIEISLSARSSEAGLAELSLPPTIKGLFSFVTQETKLSAFYIRQLHQVLTRNQNNTWAESSQGNLIEVPLGQGEWKVLPNNPRRGDGTIHQYCPPEQVASEIERLVEMHDRHLLIGIPPQIEAAWLHHRFTQIHPFQDGNGRVARMLASLIFLRSGLFPIVIKTSDRQEYIFAQEEADAGNLSRSVKLFSRLQEKIIIKGLGLS